MKRTRKGFTLVELLIVIGIISILGVMSFMAGGEATNAANATKIVDDLKMIGTAMTMYYADNKISCDKLGSGITVAQIKAGLAPYLKSSDILADTPKTGICITLRFLKRLTEHGWYSTSCRKPRQNLLRYSRTKQCRKDCTQAPTVQVLTSQRMILL